MIRLLTAALLVASFGALAQTQVPNVFEDGTPASAAEVNENFEALETAIDDVAAGADGRTILNGTAAPSSDTGAEGDFFLDTTNSMLYGPKTTSGWGSGVSLIGPTGATGEKGDTGDAGPRGPQGDTGATGPQGVQGIQGEQGAQGLQGLAGDDGADGAKGDTGATGPQGATGLTGATGPQGATGAQGDTGEQGIQGEQGPAGADGVAAGLNCSTDQIIRYDGNNWVCAYQHRGELYTPSWDPNGHFANGLPCDSCNSQVRSLFQTTRQISTDDHQSFNAYECGRDTFAGTMYPDCYFRLPALGEHSGCTMTLSENSGSLDGSCGGYSCDFDGTKLTAGEPARITVVCTD